MVGVMVKFGGTGWTWPSLRTAATFELAPRATHLSQNWSNVDPTGRSGATVGTLWHIFTQLKWCTQETSFTNFISRRWSISGFTFPLWIPFCRMNTSYNTRVCQSQINSPSVQLSLALHLKCLLYQSHVHSSSCRPYNLHSNCHL